MSSRSFRDRFGALAETVGERRRETTASDGWPLPAGTRVVDFPDGPAIVAEQVFAGAAITGAWERLAACAHAQHRGALDPATTVFLDTETTGLAGGTGTYVFLVGVGRFTGSSFIVRQFFMRHPGDERHLLGALQHELAGTSGLVTYNGRSFDVPLLETRCRMHRHDLPVPEKHVDLLSSSRAIWKHRLPNCALGTIERFVLGVTRELDAPGWMIPQLYFDYLRTRRPDGLDAVFEHNRTDIVTLARLTAIVHSYETGMDTPEHQIDRLAVALLRLRRGRLEDATAELMALWKSPAIPADLRLRGLRELSQVLKRHRRYAEAVEQWERGLYDPSRAIRLFATEELAKYLEHVARDAEQALDLARRGADGAALAGDTEALASFARRLQRLENKLQRRRAGEPTRSGQGETGS